MNASQLKYEHEQATGSNFFSRESMRFFGDTMANYGVRSAVIKTRSDESPIEVWELYRKRAVKHGLCSSAYFRKDTLQRAFAKVE